MKNHFVIFGFLIFIACNNHARQEVTNEDSTSTDTVKYVYNPEIPDGATGNSKYGEYGPPTILFDTIVNNYQFWVQSDFMGGDEACGNRLTKFFDVEDTVFKTFPLVSVLFIKPGEDYSTREYKNPKGVMYIKEYDSTDTTNSPLVFPGIFRLTFRQGKASFTKELGIGCGNVYTFFLARKNSTTVKTYREDSN